MVSAQLNGTLRIYVERPDGMRRLVKSAPAYWFAPGGSSEGVIANTPEKWNYLPKDSNLCGAGYKIVITYQGTAGTTDASDAVWILPVEVNGVQQTVGNSAHAGGLGNDNFSVDLTFGDIAIVANIETPLGILRAKEGVTFRVGGEKVYVSVENNA